MHAIKTELVQMITMQFLIVNKTKANGVKRNFWPLLVCQLFCFSK